MCVGGNWRINWIGGLSNHAPRMVSGIRGGEGVVGKPLITLQDCVMGLVSACVAIWARSTGLGAEHWRGCCVLWNLLSAERVSKALLIGVCSTRCWRGGLTEGVTGRVTGGSLTGYGAGGWGHRHG